MTALSYAGQNNKWNTAENARDVVEAIKNTGNLKCLVLEGNTLGVDAAKAIGDALSHHPEFEQAHWKDMFTGRMKNEIPEALKNLFSGLQRAGAKLVELDLSDNALGPIGVAGMVDFISSPVCYSLKHLCLNNNGLGPDGGTKLAKSLLKLAENAISFGSPLQLKVLIAGRNRLEKEGAIAFSEFFKKIGTLEEVQLPQNGIFHKGIKALAEGLSLNPNLKILNLNDNTFTRKGAEAMSHYLPEMQNLKVINFGDCLIKTKGTIYIANAIANGHLDLEELYFDNNEITINGGLAIAHAMANKNKLKTLKIDGNVFGSQRKHEITTIMKENNQLHSLAELEEDEDVEPNDEDEDSEDDAVEEEEDEDAHEETLDEDDDDDEDEDEVDEEESTDTDDSEVRREISAKVFRDNPTSGNLLGLGNSALSLLLQDIDDSSPEARISSCFELFVKVSSATSTDSPQIRNLAETVAIGLIETAFKEADKAYLMSVAVNYLLVYLGLIKHEDKKFKISWDIGKSLLMLSEVAKKDCLPSTAKQTLQCFLSLPNKYNDLYAQKHELMKSLFR